MADQKPNVIAAMRREKGMEAGPAQKTEDIIWEASQKMMPQVDKNRLFGALKKMMETGKTRLIRAGNSVFMVTQMAPDTVELHQFSSEPPAQLANSYKMLAQNLKNYGIKRAVALVDSPAYERMARSAGLNARVEQSQRMDGNRMVPAYRLTVEV